MNAHRTLGSYDLYNTYYLKKISLPETFIMAVEVQLATPLAESLQNVVQPKLVEMGWSTGGLDDSALAEYIILMLVNGKTQDQIAAELSNDLLGLGPEDSGATDFTRWLFEQVESLSGQITQNNDMANEYETSLPREGDFHNADIGQTMSQDADMDDTADNLHNGTMYVLDVYYLLLIHVLTSFIAVPQARNQ